MEETELRSKISVIIPLYKGKKYIPALLEMMDQNAEVLKDSALEVLFLNDYPKEEIDLSEVKRDYELRWSTNPENMGIHRTRVRGLELCSGEYILFLDQDDQIDSRYLASQYEKIGDADWIVCAGTYRYEQGETEEIFLSARHHACCLDKWCYYLYSNPIASPGQVLMRKNAIPEFWKRTFLEVNGSDDYLLWILMLEEGRKGVINPEKLYIHISTGENTSMDETGMRQSDYELADKLREILGWWKCRRIKRKAAYMTTQDKTAWVKLQYADVGVCRKLYDRIKVQSGAVF